MDGSSVNEKFIEYRLLEEYCSKRSPRLRVKLAVCQQPAPCSSDNIRRKKSNKKRRDESGSALRSAHTGDSGEFGDVADKLASIVDSTHHQDAIEKDSSDPSVIQRLVELMKEYGDDLNERIHKDHELMGYLQSSFTYNDFEKVVSASICSVVPTSKQKEGTHEQKAAIAWTFEMTSRLKALDLQPMNRVMGFGANYLHQHFAPWIQQHGGWEKVFNSDESEVQ